MTPRTAKTASTASKAKAERKVTPASAALAELQSRVAIAAKESQEAYDAVASVQRQITRARGALSLFAADPATRPPTPSGSRRTYWPHSTGWSALPATRRAHSSRSRRQRSNSPSTSRHGCRPHVCRSPARMGTNMGVDLTGVAAIVGAIAAPLAVIFTYVQGKANAAAIKLEADKDRAAAKALADQERADAKEAARLVAEQTAEPLRSIDGKVDGHLSRITTEMLDEKKLNVALAIDNDRLNEGTTTVPVAQTPESGAHLTRDPASGVVTLKDRRQSDP